MNRKRMNRNGITATSILVCVLTVAGALLMGLSFSPRFSPTRLSVTPPVIDLGEVDEGTISGTFELVNTGSKPIKIHGIEKSCTCNDVVATSDVAPFSKNEAKYSWTLKGINGDAVGTYVVHYSIDEPNASRKSLAVRLKARVKPDFVFDKDTVTLYLNAAQPNEVVKIVPVAQTDVKLISAKSNNPLIGVNVIDHTSFNVVPFGNDFSTDETGAAITVTTTSKHRPEAVVFVIFVRSKKTENESKK